MVLVLAGQAWCTRDLSTPSPLTNLNLPNARAINLTERLMVSQSHVSLIFSLVSIAHYLILSPLAFLMVHPLGVLCFCWPVTQFPYIGLGNLMHVQLQLFSNFRSPLAKKLKLNTTALARGVCPRFCLDQRPGNGNAGVWTFTAGAPLSFFFFLSLSLLLFPRRSLLRPPGHHPTVQHTFLPLFPSPPSWDFFTFFISKFESSLPWVGQPPFRSSLDKTE